MQIPKGNSKKLMKYILLYGCIALAVALTPFIAEPIAKLFDKVTYGSFRKGEAEWGKLRPFFREILTCIFWGLEFLAAFLCYRSFQKQGKMAQWGQSKFPFLFERRTVELAVAKEEKKRDLPLRNVMFLFLITTFSILLISAQIGFKVKPFYDFGEKIDPISFMIVPSVLVRNVVKCIWIVYLLKVSYAISECIFEKAKKEQKSWHVWMGTGLLVLCYGIYDVLITANPFVFTYLLFYIVFTSIYYFTERNGVKSFLLIAFIYIF